MNQPFTVSVKNLSDGNELHIVDIESITSDLKNCIDSKLIKICEGNVSTDLQLVKNRVIKFLTTKKGSTTELGAIAEFFIHLYLNQIGFEPQFLYLNLEEGSIKKGFDGYYSHIEEEWILESKSGSISTSGISHISKVKESYTDLEEKLAGNVKNNPWRNAYNHANLRDVGATDTVLGNIKALSDMYASGIFQDIAEFNIIPGSTIFLDGNWESSNIAEIETEINNEVSNFSFKKVCIICVTKRSRDLFWDYLNQTT